MNLSKNYLGAVHKYLQLITNDYLQNCPLEGYSKVGNFGVSFIKALAQAYSWSRKNEQI